uniref:Uncharacterized protein n=1 Tax=Heterosigma akashiwo TaxID=2829 RepID=A0A7S3YG46_HETAK
MVVRLHLERTLNVLVLVSIVVFISSIVLLSQPAASFVVKGGKQRSCCCFDSPKSKLPLISGSHFALKPFEEDGEAFDPSVLLKEKQKQWKRMQALKKAGVIDDAEDMLMIEEIESKYGVTINSQADLDALDLTEEVSEDEVLEKQISKEEEEAWVEFEEEESYAEFEAA